MGRGIRRDQLITQTARGRGRSKSSGSIDELEAAWTADVAENGNGHKPGTETERMRLIIADADPLARRVIRDSLGSDKRIVVVAEAKDGFEAVELATHYKPELVLTEVRLPCIDGIEACRRIVDKAPQVRVVMFSVDQDRAVELKALRAGASGFLSKDATTEAITRTLASVARGEAAISRRLTNQVVERLRALGTSVHKMRPLKSKLTDRQWEVLDLAAEGLNRAEIAELLDVSVATVRAHMRMALYGLDVETLEQALAKAELLRSGKA